MNLPVNETTERLVQLLRDHMDKEPPAPDLESHTGHYMLEVAQKHYQWELSVSALRTLIGARLTQEALEYLSPPTKE